MLCAARSASRAAGSTLQSVASHFGTPTDPCQSLRCEQPARANLLGNPHPHVFNNRVLLGEWGGVV